MDTVTTLVGSGLSDPRGVAVDGAGNVYVADTYNNATKKWAAADGTTTTLVGPGLYDPFGVAVDGAGNVYIADTFNNAIKELPRAFVDSTPRLAGCGAGGRCIAPRAAGHRQPGRPLCAVLRPALAHRHRGHQRNSGARPSCKIPKRRAAGTAPHQPAWTTNPCQTQGGPVRVWLHFRSEDRVESASSLTFSGSQGQGDTVCMSTEPHRADAELGPSVTLGVFGSGLVQFMVSTSAMNLERLRSYRRSLEEISAANLISEDMGRAGESCHVADFWPRGGRRPNVRTLGCKSFMNPSAESLHLARLLDWRGATRSRWKSTRRSQKVWTKLDSDISSPFGVMRGGDRGGSSHPNCASSIL